MGIQKWQGEMIRDGRDRLNKREFKTEVYWPLSDLARGNGQRDPDYPARRKMQCGSSCSRVTHGK